MGRLVKAYWDCVYCGTKMIGGDLRDCPNCGRPRGNVKFYMRDNAQNETRAENNRADIEYVSDAEAEKIGRSPDWYCSYCDSLNTNNAKFCVSCGSSREESEKNYFDLQRRKAEEAAKKAAREAGYNSGQTTGGSSFISRMSAQKRKAIIAVGAAILALIALLFIPTTKAAKVTDISWQREIDIEQYLNFEESDWSLPAGANLHSSQTEFHYYEQVLDHYESEEVERSREVLDHYEYSYTYEDLGNGYFEEVEHSSPVYTTEYYTETVQVPVYRDVPVYDTKYYYDIWRWTYVRTEKASGNSHDEHWPEYTLADDERTGENREEYSLTYSYRDKLTTKSMDYDVWSTINNGDDIRIRGSIAGAKYLIDNEGNKISRMK